MVLEEPEDILDLKIQFNENDYDNFMDLVTRNYSRYTPFYTYKMTLKDSKDEKDLDEKLNAMSFDKGNVSIHSRYDFTKIEYNTYKKRKLTIYYNKYSVFNDGEKEQKDGIIKKGIVTVTFNIKDNLMYINIGEDSLNGIIKRYLVDKLYTCITIEPLRIVEPNIKYRGPIGVDKITVFMLELLTRKIKEKGNLIINDYIKVGISNQKSEKIKSVIIKGNDLFNDKEVALKIQNGFKLKTADFNLSWILPGGNNSVNLSVSISVQSTVKISIIETTNRIKNLEIIKGLSECIIELLEEEIILKTDVITHYFGAVRDIMNAQKRISREMFMNEIMKDESLRQYAKRIEEIYNTL